MAKNEPGAVNIFNVTDPAEYRCQILHYHARLSRLYLRVFKGAADYPAFYLLFADVAYLDCPAAWQGANFQIADPDECIALMLETNLIGKAILQYPGAYASITDYARLYMVKTSGRPVRLIANSASMLNSLPDGIGTL